MVRSVPMTAPPTQAHVITVLNLKGGVGKKYTAWLLASGAEEPGGAVLERKHLLLEGIVENWQRANLKPFELADALDRTPRPARVEPGRNCQTDREAEERDFAIRLAAEDRPRLATRTPRGRIQHIQPPSPRGSRELPGAAAGTDAEDQDEKLTAPEIERAAVRMLKRTWNKSPQTRAGTIRRFVIGAATVEVKFRRSGVGTPRYSTCFGERPTSWSSSSRRLTPVNLGFLACVSHDAGQLHGATGNADTIFDDDKVK